MPLYHFTDIAHLPWILHTGELRPGRNKIGAFPDPDFLWATDDERGDRTATCFDGGGYRKGIDVVRFTLDPDGFMPWREIPGQFPQWTQRHVDVLHRVAQDRGVNPASWWCRLDPLRLATGVAEVHTKTFRDSQWKPLGQVEVRPSGRGFQIQRPGRPTLYCERMTAPAGNYAYGVKEI